MSSRRPLVLGIDVGTSGVRIAALDEAGEQVAAAEAAMAVPQVRGGLVRQQPEAWRAAILEAFAGLATRIDPADVRAIAVDATSGTMVATDREGRPVGDALMYNDTSGARFAAAIEAVAPAETAARGPASGLARALFLSFARHPERVLHQADWIAGLLTGRFDLTDESNALKTGYDPVARTWPDWIGETGLSSALLPGVLPAGAPFGPAEGPLARQVGLPRDAKVVGGCTDGCAAFLASGASEPGDAATSLGSTLTLKILSDRPVFKPEKGIYSHRIGELWLPGGASNAGGAAIARAFDTAALSRLEPALDPERPTGLDYYPMTGRGERFPVADPGRVAVMEPRPADEATYLQGLYESLARIEAAGYEALRSVGAPAPVRIYSLGGGAASPAFTRIRERILDVPLVAPRYRQASVGVARLALPHL